MLNRAARSMGQAGVSMASKATGLNPDQIAGILPVIGRSKGIGTEVDTGMLRDLRSTIRPATAAGSGTVIAPGQDQKVMKSRVRSELNKFNPQSLITKSETGLAIEESKNREQAARDAIAAINAEREKLNPVYDSSSPFNMAMSVAPRENMKSDEGMVAESAQRARERLAGATQPGGMVSTDALKRMANREAQARLAPQRALAQREDVHPLDEKTFTRRVDRNPDSPTYGKAFVSGLYPQVGDTLNSAEARREARQSGGVFESPDGAITDYGKLNARNERRAEESQAARELRTRTAQVQGMNPRLSRAGAAGVAAGQLRNEQLMQDQMRRQQDDEMAKRRQDMLLEAYKANPNDPRLQDAFSEDLGLRDRTPDEQSRYDRDQFNLKIGNMTANNELTMDPRQVPGAGVGDLDPETRSKLAAGIDDALKSDLLTDEDRMKLFRNVDLEVMAELIGGTAWDQNYWDGERSEKLYKDFEAYLKRTDQLEAPPELETRPSVIRPEAVPRLDHII